MSGRDEIPERVKWKRETCESFKRLLERIRGETIDYPPSGDTDSIMIIGDTHVGRSGFSADLIISDELRYIIENSEMSVCGLLDYYQQVKVG